MLLVRGADLRAAFIRVWIKTSEQIILPDMWAVAQWGKENANTQRCHAEREEESKAKPFHVVEVPCLDFIF
jgi:hypothetical protein